MPIYKIHWLEEKQTSTGKVKADVTLIDSEGKQIGGVTVWGDFPNFKDLRPEGTIEGDIVEKGNWKTLYAAKNKNGTGKPNNIAKAMEKKEASIEKFQDKKMDNIQAMATFRDATLITNLYFQLDGAPFTNETYMAKWKEVRSLLSRQLEEPPF